MKSQSLVIIILHKVHYQHQYEVDDLFEKACLVGCLLSFVLLLICPLAEHLVHVEVVVAQNGAEGVQEETWENIFKRNILTKKNSVNYSKNHDEVMK